MTKKEPAPNIDAFIQSTISALQDEDKEYRKYLCKAINSYWYNDNGELCSMSGVNDYIRLSDVHKNNMIRLHTLHTKLLALKAEKEEMD